MCVCGCACACMYTRLCHLSTLDNPHPGQAQTAVFQNTAEGNYKLGQPLDHEAGGILSPQRSPAKTGLGQVNNDSDLPTVTKSQAGVLHKVRWGLLSLVNGLPVN